MRSYTVPAALIDDYLNIKTHLARKYATYYLSGYSKNVSYTKACKDLKKKPAKNVHDSALKIHSNSSVFKFIAKAQELLSAQALQNAAFSFSRRLEVTSKVIEIGLAQYATGAKTNAADILKAVEIQNQMLGATEDFKDTDLEELYRLAGENKPE